MSLPTETQVLIIGAGPTGMACALTLLGHGVRPTIVDASEDNKNGSRSIVIHARTLEVLKDVGLAKPLIQAGIESPGAVIYGGATVLTELDVGLLRDETEFPFALLIPQDDVERILREKLIELGVRIFRPHSVVGLNEASSGVGLEITFDDGSVVSSRYVIGADGSRSTIRQLANIEFKDPATGVDYDGKMPPSSTFQIALADVHFKEPLPKSIQRDRVSLHLDRFVLMCPLRSASDLEENGLSFWRIGIASPSGGPPLPRSPDINWLQTQLNDRCPAEILPHIASVLHSSRYRVRAAVAGTFFKKIGGGNILLVGDAAHVHSPAGGQGLNLGLCDAVALGNAVHAHIGGAAQGDETASDSVFNHYSTSRRKMALRVVRLTKTLTTLINTVSGWKIMLRNLILRVVGKILFIRRAAAWRVSGLINRDV